MKKSFVIGLCALTLTPALKAGDFYVGAGTGYGFGSAKTTGDLRDINGGFKNTDIALKGLQGTFYAGWGKTICDNRAYVGGEIAGDLSDVKGKDHSSISEAIGITANSNKLLSYRYGFSTLIKGGLFLDPKKLVYLKAGPTMGRWSLDTKTDTANAAGNALVLQTANRTSNLLGVKVAVGAEAEISPHVYAGFEYNYALYQKMSVNKTATTGQNFSYQTQPSLGVFMVTLTRKF